MKKNFYGLFLIANLGIIYAQEELRPKGPLTDHFVNWLIANGYEGDTFDRPDIGPSGSFGGRLTSISSVILNKIKYIKVFQIVHEPVVFIHGTGDAALHTQGPIATGWYEYLIYLSIFLGHVPFNIFWSKIILVPSFMQQHGVIHGDREIF